MQPCARYADPCDVCPRSQMVEDTSIARITFPLIIRAEDHIGLLHQHLWTFLLCQLLQTKLMQALRFKAGEVQAKSPDALTMAFAHNQAR